MISIFHHISSKTVLYTLKSTKAYVQQTCLTLKRLWVGGGGGLDSLTSWPPYPQSPHALWFSKNVFSRERLKPCFFVTFKIIKSHIFPANFNVITQVIQKIWRYSLSILPIFIDFSDFLYFLVAKKLITSAYNRWYQNFFTFDLLKIGCLTIV